MAMNRTTSGAVLRPEQVADLVIRPVVGELGSPGGMSVASRVATVERIVGPSLRIPIVSADAQAAWVLEGQEIPTSDAVLGEITVSPSALAALTKISTELAVDSSPSAARAVADSLSRDLVRQLDTAFFGNLAAPAPVGLEGLVGVSDVAAGTAWTNLDPFAEALSAVEVEGATVDSFVANPVDVLALSKIRDETGSNRTLLASGTGPGSRSILGVPLISCAQVAPGVVWGIPRDRTMLVIRQEADLVLLFERYAEFRQVGIRVDMRAAFGFPHPAAIARLALTP